MGSYLFRKGQKLEDLGGSMPYYFEKSNILDSVVAF